MRRSKQRAVRHVGRFLRLEPLEDRRVLATFMVTDLADSGAGSLREAIEAANLLPGADVIDFANALDGQTIAIASELVISESVSIDATALTNGITLDATLADSTPGVDDGMGSRIFRIDDGNSMTQQSVSAAGLTLTGGDVDGNGGAVRSSELFELSNSTVSGNFSTGRGGGLAFERYSSFQLDDVEISDNEAQVSGGGLHAYGGSYYEPLPDVSIRNSQIVFNRNGGAVISLSYSSQLDVADSTFSSNTGTGLAVSTLYGATASVVSSVFEGNQGGSGIRISSHPQSGANLIDDCVIRGNVASHGAGIVANADESLIEIRGSTISGNVATGSGGGIRTFGGEYGGVNLINSRVFDNEALEGGGMSSYMGGGTDIKVVASTIEGNRSTGAGGGIHGEFGFGTYGARSNFEVAGSTISGNSAGIEGGGIALFDDYAIGGSVSINNSTVAGNTAGAGGGGVSISSTSPLFDTSITHSTIADNIADDDGSEEPDQRGGGIHSTTPDAPNFEHSIVADNSRGTTATPDDTYGNLDGEFSLFEFNSGGSISGTTNLTGLDPHLGSLSDNGGPTRTIRLLATSPAIDAGDPNAVADTDGVPEFDQRGLMFPRVVNDRIDLGALEVDTTLVDGDFNDDGAYDCADIDGLVGEIAAATNNSSFDLNSDGAVDLLDRDAWLAEAGEVNLGPGKTYLLGDATLDGVVDGADFLIWNANKFAASTKWCNGDFNADGNVDGVDFLIWNANKFQSSDVSLPQREVPTNSDRHLGPDRVWEGDFTHAEIHPQHSPKPDPVDRWEPPMHGNQATSVKAKSLVPRPEFQVTFEILELPWRNDAGNFA